MSERYSRIFTLSEGLYSKDAPILIKAGALLRDNETSFLLAQIKLCNVSDKTVKFAKVEINCFDSVGRQLDCAINFEYLDLAVSRGGEFGAKTPIKIANSSVRAYTVKVVEVGFADNSVWVDNGNEWSAIQSQREIGAVIKDTDTLVGYKAKFGNGAAYEALVQDDIWLCTCGEINRRGEENCYKCNAKLGDLVALDYDELKQEGIYRYALELSKRNNAVSLEKAITEFAKIESYKDSAEQIKRINDLNNAKSEEKKQKKKLVKKLSIIISALACLCLLGYFVAYPLISYWSGDYKVYINMYNVKEFTIPDGVTSIGDYEFGGCSSLTSVVIPDSVTSIGSNAFENCSSLESIEIPDSVTSIGSNAFENCSSLTSIEIPDSVTSIGNYAFINCSSLTSVTIGDSVTSIGEAAFYGCSSLESIEIPDSVTSIGSYVFSECSSLTSLKIGDNVTSIDSYAFSECSNLVNATIPASAISYMPKSNLQTVVITSGVIGSSAFSDCHSLTSVKIGNGVTSIGSSAFYNCSSLESVEIPDSVTGIGYDAFENCSSLKSVVIGYNVKSIGQYAFYGCANLKNVYYTGSQEQWKKISISGWGNDALKNATIIYNYVPEG